MKAKHKTIPALLIACLTIASCATSGGGTFCDVVAGPILFPPPVAEVVVTEARDEAERIDTQNQFGYERCGW